MSFPDFRHELVPNEAHLCNCRVTRLRKFLERHADRVPLVGVGPTQAVMRIASQRKLERIGFAALADVTFDLRCATPQRRLDAMKTIGGDAAAAIAKHDDRRELRAIGQVAVLQDMFLNVEISNGVATTKAACVNTDRFVSQPWPRLQINLEQTNGTLSKVYYLDLIAVPIPQLRLLIPEAQPGDVRLEWDDHGAKFQLERATNAGGPYLPLNSQPTESPFTDVGVVTNHSQFFYRLRQF